MVWMLSFAADSSAVGDSDGNIQIELTMGSLGDEPGEDEGGGRATRSMLPAFIYKVLLD